MSIQENHLKTIADAIREKDGTTEPISANDFSARILAIPTGGGAPDDVRTISLTADPPEGGTVSGGGYASDGMKITVSANNGSGYSFSQWQESGASVSNEAEYTFTVTKDRTLTAAFAVASRLPEGYTELEYISTDGYARIPTGIRATIDTTRVVMDVNPIEHRDVRAYFFDALNYYSSNFTYGFGLRNNETAGSMNWFSGYWGISSGGFASFSYSFNYGKRITIDMDCPAKKLNIGNTSISISPATNTSVKDAGDLNFGGYYPTDSSSFTQRMNIYSAQVYLSGVLKGDFVPCTKDDGTIGLYNMVDHTFYGASYGTLTPGPAV